VGRNELVGHVSCATVV